MAFKSMTPVILITLTLSAGVKAAMINNIVFTPDTFSGLDWLYSMESLVPASVGGELNAWRYGSVNNSLVDNTKQMLGGSQLAHADALLGVGTNTRVSLGEAWMPLVFTIPAVIWLLVSGLFGLIGMARGKGHIKL